MSKHTPGPWKLVWRGNERYPFPLSVLSADESTWIARDGTASSEANARLIAAAPEMLEALKYALDCATGKGRDYFGKLEKRMADAIAKAEGKE